MARSRARGASRAPGPVPPRNRLCGLDKLRNPPCLTFLIRGTKEEVTAAIRTERVAPEDAPPPGAGEPPSAPPLLAWRGRRRGAAGCLGTEESAEGPGAPREAEWRFGVSPWVEEGETRVKGR